MYVCVYVATLFFFDVAFSDSEKWDAHLENGVKKMGISTCIEIPNSQTHLCANTLLYLSQLLIK